MPLLSSAQVIVTDTSSFERVMHYLNVDKTYCSGLHTINAIFPYMQSNHYQVIRNPEVFSDGQVRDNNEGGNKYIGYSLHTNEIKQLGDVFNLGMSFDVATININVNFDAIKTIYPYDTSSKEYVENTGDLTTCILPHHPHIEAIANELWAQSSDIIDYARRCYEYTATHLEYFNANTGLHSLQDIIDKGGGDCGNFASYYISLLRNRNIPSRHVVGVIEQDNYHVWAEFYLQNYGWIPVDPTFKHGNPNGDYFGHKNSSHYVTTLGLELTNYKFAESDEPMQLVLMQLLYYFWWTYDPCTSALFDFKIERGPTVDNIVVCNDDYVLCFDDWDKTGTAKPGKGSLFGNDFFLDVTGGEVSTSKGTVNLSKVNTADNYHVTQYIANKYGAAHPNNHFNSWRLKNTQDMIAMKVTANSKLIFFLQGNNKTGTEARIPKIWDGRKGVPTDNDIALNEAPGANFPKTSSGFRYEWTAPEDMLIYIGSYNNDIYLSYLIVETNDTNPPITYKLSYYVDGKIYKTYELKEGETIIPEAPPTKEGYTFSGWSEIPTTMPANDVTVTGLFTVNKYKLTYVVDGVEYKSFDIEYGSAITPETAPTKEGYTFSGWSEIPTTMPAHDVTVTGTFTVNQYTITYIIDNEVYTTQTVDYGSTIIPPTTPEREGYDFAWGDYPETMPAYDITIYGTYTTGIESIVADPQKARIYDLNGVRQSEPQKDINIINGKKYVKK